VVVPRRDVGVRACEHRQHLARLDVTPLRVRLGEVPAQVHLLAIDPYRERQVRGRGPPVAHRDDQGERVAPHELEQPVAVVLAEHAGGVHAHKAIRRRGAGEPVATRRPRRPAPVGRPTRRAPERRTAGRVRRGAQGEPAPSVYIAVTRYTPPRPAPSHPPRRRGPSPLATAPPPPPARQGRRLPPPAPAPSGP